jgi:hypothetical protein
MNKQDILNRLEQFPYNKGDYVITYKAALVLLDIFTECHDIDIECNMKMGNELKKLITPTVAPLGGDMYHYNDDIDCFTRELDYPTLEVYGYKVINPKEQYIRYLKRNRPKDKETILVLEKYLGIG